MTRFALLTVGMILVIHGVIGVALGAPLGYAITTLGVVALGTGLWKDER